MWARGLKFSRFVVVGERVPSRPVWARGLKSPCAAPYPFPASVASELEPWLCDRVFNIVHLIYQAKPHEEQFKDYAFGPAAMRRNRWPSAAPSSTTCNSPG